MARADMVGFFWDDTPPPKPPKKEAVKRQPPPRTWERDDYLPHLDEALAFNVPVMDDQELYQAMLRQERLVFDVECYPNYFLAAFKSVVSGKFWFTEFQSGQALQTEHLKWVLDNFCVITFYGNGYDIPITSIALKGCSTQHLHACTQEMIEFERPAYQVLQRNKVKRIRPNHIDLCEVAPSACSLKLYGGRMGTPRMQDLPFPPSKALTQEQIACVRWYCLNDLFNTEMLYNKLHSEITLRETMSREYNLDLRSKSDAQIAEAVIAQEIKHVTGSTPRKPTIEIGTCYRYQVPYFIKYYSTTMQWALNIVKNALFVVGDSGSVGMPPELSDLEIPIGNGIYRIGIGGLHSSEKSVGHRADENTILIDRDVTSYYPFIILNQELYPEHLTRAFLNVYRGIVERRLHAKASAKDLKTKLKTIVNEMEKVWAESQKDEFETIADSLKITINGSFGKLGSCHSVLYSPNLLIQVTITGQLALLMLIERLELTGIPVVSANTDGIVIKCPKHLEATMDLIVKCWEQETNFQTEATRYKALYSRDVNNYIALKEEGGYKGKGVFGGDPLDPLKKNPQNQICTDAITEFLLNGVPIAKTIYECRDIAKFATVRTVKGGAVKVWSKTPVPAHSCPEELIWNMGFREAEGGTYRHPNYQENNFTKETAYETAKEMSQGYDHIEYLGKAIRWYYAKDVHGEIVYARSGNKVPLTDNAQPMMELPKEFPSNLDLEWYEREANKCLAHIGYC